MDGEKGCLLGGFGDGLIAWLVSCWRIDDVVFAERRVGGRLEYVVGAYYVRT